MKKINVAVLASGRGSNFKALIDAINAGKVNASIKVLITDNPKAGAIVHAQTAGIPVEVLEKERFSTRNDMDKKIKEILDANAIDLVVLAGYMRIIVDKKLLDAYKYKIINIHPSLLPAFKGSMNAQLDAFQYGCKVSGLTIHFVTEDVDGGPIIHQEAVYIGDCKSPEEVSSRILSKEHEAYPRIVDSFSKGKYVVDGRKTTFIPF